MKITDCRQWIDDLDETIASLPELVDITGNTVMITGCTGLICSALVDLLARFNETHEEKISILAAGRNVDRINDRFLRFSDQSWFEIVQYDALSADASWEKSVDYVIQGAGNAYPEKIVSEPVETILGSITGVKVLLDKARQGQIGRVVYISSSEVYGRRAGNKPLGINDYGSIDLSNFRNSYPIGKSAAEMLCVSYAKEYGVDSVIVRPGHIYGPTASPGDNRVGSVWAYKAASGEPIVMKSDGSQIRSYCYTLDFTSALVKIMRYGHKSCAYNVSNPDSVISIKQLAKLYAKAGETELAFEIPEESEKRGFNPMDNSSLNAEELLSLGWRGLFDAERGTKHTVGIIKEMNGK